MVKEVSSKRRAHLRLVSEALTFRASAIAEAPEGPILFRWRLRLASEALTSRALPIAAPPLGPMLLSSKLPTEKRARGQEMVRRWSRKFCQKGERT